MRKETTIRDRAYNEVYNWLDGDKKGPEPMPEPGMHPLAESEWQAGHDEAHADYIVEEEEWAPFEDLVVCVVKTALLYGLLWAGHYIGTWWSLIVAGSVGFIFLWRFWR
jgi:hypothetical protein